MTNITNRYYLNGFCENLQLGAYSQVFEAKDITSGIYFYQLQADGMVQTKKLTVIK